MTKSELNSQIICKRPINENEITDSNVAKLSSMYCAIKITHVRRFDKRVYNKGTKKPPEIKINKVKRRLKMYYPQMGSFPQKFY